MKKMYKMFACFWIISGLVSCANNHNTANEEKSSALSDGDHEKEKQVTTSDQGHVKPSVYSSEVNLNPDEDLFNDKKNAKSAVPKDSPKEETEISQNKTEEKSDEKMSANGSEQLNAHIVNKNETLMIIAFKIYGDYSKWRELSKINNNIGNQKLVEGEKIYYKNPEIPFDWNPVGLPYLIKTGDTLSKISTKVYGSTKGWKSIWDNNKPLIHDPNLIFVGFTIYYLEKLVN